MHVLFFLPSIRKYKDRVRLLMEVSQGLDRLTLLVGLKDAEISLEGYDRFRLVEVGFRQGNRPYNVWKANKLAKKMILTENVNIVHDTFGTLFPLFYKKKKCPKVKFVTSLFSLNGWRRRNVFGHFCTIKMLSNKSTAQILFNQILEKQICIAADHVVVQAPGLIDRLIENAPVQRSKVHEINNNVDTDFWRPNINQVDCENKTSSFQLLFVGGIAFSKGIFVLIEAMRLLRQAGDNSVLKVIGNWVPFDSSLVIQKIHESGLETAIEFVQKVGREDLRNFYQNSDLFLYQTIDDGSPRVVLEALACGLPVVAAHHPGIDVIDPQGKFISFTQFGDAIKIAEIVQSLRMDKEQLKKKSKLGREEVVRHFCTKTVARQYVGLYQSLTRT